MRMGWLVTLVLMIAATMTPIAVGQVQEAQGEQAADICSLPEGWDPAEDLPRILAEHRRWLEQWEANNWSAEWARNFPQGQANLCKINLNGATLTKAQLFRATLTKAQLSGADLTEAGLGGATLTKAILTGATLTEAQLFGATLAWAQLDGANLDGANLTGSTYAPASPAPDAYVADIQGLQTVVFPKGREIGLVQLRELLQKAGLRDPERQATYAIERGKTWHLLNLFDHWQSDRSASYKDLQPAERRRREAEDNSFVMNALNSFVGFDLLGLGKAVFYHPKVAKSILSHRGEVGEGLFRLVAFDWTTGYGLYPGHALWIILCVWAVLILVYIWPILRRPRSPKPAFGIYRIWPGDRIEVGSYQVKLGTSAKVERLQGKSWWRSFGYAAYFSMLSAFHIGWRDLNVGTWISRMQPREYALRATGWVRFVSGLQSLLSVYLLAIWALTYFGRPFQ